MIGFGFFKRKADTPQAAEIEAHVAASLERVKRHMRPVISETARVEQDAIIHAVGALEAAAMAVDGLTDVLSEARELVESASETESEAKRALIAERYDEVLGAIGPITAAADFDGVNLVDDSQDALSVAVDGPGDITFAVAHVKLTLGDGGLDLPPPREAFSTDDEIIRIRDAVAEALGRINTLGERFCADAAMLAMRLPDPEATQH